MSQTSRGGKTAKSASEEAKALTEKTRSKDLFNVLLGLRIVNALTLLTFFQPDEFYQALEPAWALAFGRGEHLWVEGAHDGPWVTWEWKNQLRSSLYPFLYAGVYKIAGPLSNLLPPRAKVQALIYSPKIVQAIGAAAMDFYTFKLAGRVYGPFSTESWATLFLSVFSPWQWFVSTRSMTNCLETTLTVIALYFWPWEWVKGSTDRQARAKDTNNLKWCVLLAATASILRPPNVLIWVILSLFTLPRATQSEFFGMVNAASIWGSVVLVASMGADYLYYGEVTFPPINFFTFNVERGIASFYGVNRPDYYFTEGIPQLLTFALPFAITGLSQALAGRFLTLPADTEGGALYPSVLRSLAVVTIAFPAALSFIDHKEARFIYPILPILFIIISRPVIGFFHPFPNPSSAVRKGILGIFLISNIVLAGYLGFFHNRGVMDVIGYLRKEHERHNPGMVNEGITENINKTNVAILAPCHSTPWRSHLVYPEIAIWSLTCDPPINKTVINIDDGFEPDETDNFYEDIDKWIRYEFGTTRRAWPDYVVYFDSLRPDMQKAVAKHAFELGWSGFNSLWHEDPRRQGNVNVWVKTIPYGGVGKADDPMLEVPPDEEGDEALRMLQETNAKQERGEDTSLEGLLADHKKKAEEKARAQID